MRPLLLFASALLASSASLAQASDVVFPANVEPPAASPESPDEVRESSAALALRAGHLGLEAFEAEQLEEALVAFTRAESLAHSPVFVLYQGRAAERLGRWLEARDYFRIATAEPLTDASPSTWRSSVEQAREHLVAIESRIPRVLLRIQGAVRFPVVVTVVSRERTLESGPAEFFEALPGQYQINATDEAGQEVTQIWSAREGERNVEIALVFRARLPSAALASASPHDPSPSHRWNVQDRAAFSALGMGSVGIVLGAVFGGIAASQFQSFKDRCQGNSCLPEDEEVGNQARVWAQLSTVGFVVGGVGLATGGLLLLTSPPAEKGAAKLAGNTSRAMTLQLGVSSRGLLLSGHF